MFKIESDPKFDACFTIVGQGREQKLNVTCNAVTRSDYADKLKAIADGECDVADVVLSLIAKWDADAPLEKASIEKLEDHQPGACWAILTGYGQALTVARKGN